MDLESCGVCVLFFKWGELDFIMFFESRQALNVCINTQLAKVLSLPKLCFCNA